MTAAMDTSHIPQALRERRQWVGWRLVERDGKPTKLPVCTRTGQLASSTDATTWDSYENAIASVKMLNLSGIGYVFSANDPFFGVDLDDCLDYFGQPYPEAKAIIDALDTYCEVSPSGAGVKLIGKGRKPEGAQCRTKRVQGFDELEVYDRDRFFTITGKRLDGTPAEVRDAQEALSALCARHLMASTTEARKSPAATVPADDEALLAVVRRSKQSDKFDRLWRGQIGEYGDDESAADFALASVLAFWTAKDEDRTEQLMRRSGLYRRKWDEKRGDTTYLRYTIHRAVERTNEVYTPGTRECPDWDAVLKAAAQQSDVLGRFLQDTIAGKRRPVEWPWTGVHRMTRALIPQTVTVLCGSPGASKSFLLMQSLVYWHEQGVPIAALMLEDGKAYHLRRAMAQRVRDSRLTDDEWIEDNPDIVTALHEQHAAFFKQLQARIDEPPPDKLASAEVILSWLKHRAESGARVLAVDPITLADSGDKQWVADRQLIASVKKVAEKYNVSVVLVTHPQKHAVRPEMDSVAGGATVTRAAQTVLWLEYMKDDESVMVMEPAQQLRVSQVINRKLHILKSRNAKGQGFVIGMKFSHHSLRLDEAGVILR